MAQGQQLDTAGERIAELSYLAVNIRHARIPSTELRREVVAAIRELQGFIRADAGKVALEAEGGR